MTDPNGWSNFWRLFYSDQWEPDTRFWIHRTLMPGDLFLDIGAWIGPTTQWALDRDAIVIAVEPDPVAFGELDRVFGGRAELWEAALVGREQDGWAHISPSDGGQFGDSMSHISTGGTAVLAYMLDGILGDRVPRAVKIDIEGFEYELLPAILPQLAEMRCELHVSFHDPENLPTEWFADWDWFYLRGLELEAGFVR